MITTRRGFLAALIAAPVLARVAPPAAPVLSVAEEAETTIVTTMKMPYWHGQYPIVVLRTHELIRLTEHGLARGCDE